MRRPYFFRKFLSSFTFIPFYDDNDEEKRRVLSEGEYIQKVSKRKDIFVFINSRLFFGILTVCIITAIGLGIWLSIQEPVVEVAPDFYEKMPEKNIAKTLKSIPATLNTQKKVINGVKKPGGKIGGGGDPRARVKKKGVLGIVSGKIKDKTVASADIFRKGGNAKEIDAILSGVGGLKAGNSGGTGRKGAAGIGYGVGYGSGFGGGCGGVNLGMLKKCPRIVSKPMYCRTGEAYPTNFNTENYNVINENSFKEVIQEPLSTFSIDVDVASYSNIRRFINYSQLPPKDAVRIEEMINYFTYQYPQPKGRHPFSITTEVSACPWEKKHKIIHIGLQGKKVVLEDVAPSNLVFLMDVSGSMQSYDKLPLLKSSLRMLVNQLRTQDKVSIVVYAGSAGLVLPPTSAERKRNILQAIDNLQAGGSTAGGQGIKLAYKIAKENYIQNGNNRVILATDGDFNVGVSSDAELVRLIEEKRKDGIFLTVLGFGTGNYKDSKMEQLADKGNGNYAYIDNILEAKKVLVNEMDGTLFTIAKDVKIQIEFNPNKVYAYRLIGYENRALKKEDFNDDKKDARELGSGHSVTALYEIIPAGVKAELPNVDDLKYQKTVINEKYSETEELITVKFRYKDPEGSKSRLMKVVVKDEVIDPEEVSEDFVFSAAVAGFGQLLRKSEHNGDLTFDKIIKMAQSSIGKDKEGYRSEFLNLVKKCKLLGASG
jgi:Ca-activated chloride channel family protein